MREQFIRRKTKKIVREDGRIRISVIIPTKNEEKLLEACLQEFTPELKREFDLELIVSDGGSRDATIGIAAAYADKIATHEDPDRRQTIAEGRNRGAALATGDLFIFLNADSTIVNPKEFLARVRTRFALDPALEALAVKVKVAPIERRFSDVIFHFCFNFYVHLLNLFGMGMGRGECHIIRREAFEALGGYNMKLAAGEDFELYKRIKQFGKVRYDSKLLVYESPRRFRKFGYMSVFMQWSRNGISVLINKRSASEVWEEVR
jgi:glycosyltransferase involved in cell wall biosynthesis